MSRSVRNILAPFVACIGLALVGCANVPGETSVAGTQAAIEGVIASIDTQPWAYDGNAVIEVDTDARGRVSVQLPARWNLCRAAPVDVAALSIGMRVRVVGTTGEEGELVVCQDAVHRLVPMG